MRVVLNVAEKPMVARAIKDAFLKLPFVLEPLVSGDSAEVDCAPKQHTHSRPMPSLSRFNPVFECSRSFQGRQATLFTTSVTGHILDFKFVQSVQHLAADPRRFLCESAVERSPIEGMQNVIDNLIEYAKRATDLFLWLDCDREGEAIAQDVSAVCLKVNPHLKVHRAKFSSVQQREVLHAFENPVSLNKDVAGCVLARQEIDLRGGYAFSTLQTSLLKDSLKSLRSTVFSFGSCQFPVLVYVTERFLARKAFTPEPLWFISAVIVKDGIEAEVSWDKGHSFDHEEVKKAFGDCGGGGTVKGQVVAVGKTEDWVYKPLPMTTIELIKMGTMHLGWSSEQVMRVAEELYLEGCISYPRTETDTFPKGFPFREYLKRLEGCPDIGPHSAALQSDDCFHLPRVGTSNDNAHPPIYPIKPPSDNQSSKNTLFDLIARHFIASCSKNALVEKSLIRVAVGDQHFTSQGLRVVEQNFLKVYSAYHRLRESQLPNLGEGTWVELSKFSIKKTSTKPPQLLTESELADLMYKNGIGTDATIPMHIATIQKRRYAFKQYRHIVPSQLGVALVSAYKMIGSKLTDTGTRAETERGLQMIASGQLGGEEFVKREVGKLTAEFDSLVNDTTAFEEYFTFVFNYLNDQKNMSLKMSPRAEDGKLVLEEFMQKQPVPDVFCKGCNGQLWLQVSFRKRPYLKCDNDKCFNYSFLKPHVKQVIQSDQTCTECQHKTVEFRTSKNGLLRLCLGSLCKNSVLSHIREDSIYYKR